MTVSHLVCFTQLDGRKSVIYLNPSHIVALRPREPEITSIGTAAPYQHWHSYIRMIDGQEYWVRELPPGFTEPT